MVGGVTTNNMFFEFTFSGISEWVFHSSHRLIAVSAEDMLEVVVIKCGDA